MDSIESHAHYDKVLEWRNAFVDAEHSALLGKIARQTLAWYEEGWRLRTSEKVHLGLALADVPPALERVERTRSQLNLFTDDVVEMWARLKRRGRLHGLDPDEKEALLQTVYAKYRDRYFYRVDNGPVVGRMSEPPDGRWQ